MESGYGCQFPNTIFMVTQLNMYTIYFILLLGPKITSLLGICVLGLGDVVFPVGQGSNQEPHAPKCALFPLRHAGTKL